MGRFRGFAAALLAAALLAAAPPGRAVEPKADPDFPAPPELESSVRFWVDVFTRYSRDQVIVHDMDFPGRIYALVDVAGLSPDVDGQRQKRDKRVAGERDRIAGLLRALADRAADDTSRTEDERRLIALFDTLPPPGALRRAADRIRSQSGLRESFLEGIVRSGRTLGEIRRIFRDEGVPEELVYLPHVESSFNPRAVSKAGAVGVWQFTKSTGRLFMTVDEGVDERLDPLLSARAAARLLRRNYEATGRWPLAVTAYNHGLLSIRKAMRDLNTDDLMDLIRAYEAKPFGFASKNFYAEFLAAARIAADPGAYFGEIRPDPPVSFTAVELPLPLKIGTVKRVFAADGDTLALLNPAFRKPVLEGKREIPAGYDLRLPVSTDVPAAFEALASLGLLPRGAWRAWCRETSKDLFRYVDPDEGSGPDGFEPRS
jgi:membrane-bound lytic murein transglycosylase D